MTEIRLRDGLRDGLLVFLAVRIGLSLLSVTGVHLIEPLAPVSVPGWPATLPTTGWHNVWDAPCARTPCGTCGSPPTDIR